MRQPLSSMLSARPQHNPPLSENRELRLVFGDHFHTQECDIFVKPIEFNFFHLKDERASRHVSQNVNHLLWTGRRAISLLLERDFFPSKVVAAETQLSQENKQRQMPEIIVWFLSWTQTIGSEYFCETQKIQAMYSTEDLSEHLVLFSGCKRLKQSRNTF